MAVPKLRECVFDAVVEWYENYVTVRFEPVEKDSAQDTTVSEPVASGGTESAEVAIKPPTKIEKVMKPTYLPEGAEEDVVVNTKAMVIIEYYINDDVVITYRQKLIDGNTWLDNKAIICSVEINGKSGVAFEDEDGSQGIVWTDGEYCYHINSMILDIDELIIIASSVQSCE